MTLERYRHRRTRGSGPPADLLYGEIAYADADQAIWIGRPDNLPPVQVGNTPTPGTRTAAGKVRILALGGFRQ